MNHVRGIDGNHGLLVSEHVAKGSAVEYVLVVVFRGKVTAIIKGGEELSPVVGIDEYGPGKVSLDILFQESTTITVRVFVSTELSPLLGRCLSDCWSI